MAEKRRFLRSPSRSDRGSPASDSLNRKRRSHPEDGHVFGAEPHSATGAGLKLGG
ncbi:hypothetical protein RSSM_03194 [Rhodopirellula sallentina SM41]|uniref:Uncharacterized protein n=1 Tax=Rhodopirellula sallentina SM41 TaxID=1263870 RepID=M5U1P4_9BACT|nr:hypothetical protein RSSM_03194 [Rhodopirellula sallentina SM41]